MNQSGDQLPIRRFSNMAEYTQASRSSSAQRAIRFLVFVCVTSAAAQTSITGSAPVTTGPITLTEVVQTALRDYPQIPLSQEELNASVANIQLARTAYLPRVDGLIQANRATRNNVYGLLFPQTVIPPMTGPVIGSNNGGSVWGSAAGFLVAWQPFDFGLRHANVEAARAGRDKADATLQRSQLEVSAAAADAYLTLIAAGQTEKAAAAAVENWDTLLRSIHALASA